MQMATIDTSIIKTLVDHIGGDSSSIPDGIIGGGEKVTDTAVPYIWESNALNYISYTYLSKERPKPGMILKLYNKGTMEYETFSCTVAAPRSCVVSNAKGEYIKLNNCGTVKIDDTTHYKMTTGFTTTTYALPDNEDTGFFIPKTNSMLYNTLAGITGSFTVIPELDPTTE